MQAPIFIQNYYQDKIIKKLPLINLLKKEVVNLNDAKLIGILYYLDDDKTYKLVSDFVKNLQRKDKNVKAIAYVKDKYLTKRYLPKLSYDFFYEKDLNWFGRPNGNYVDEFVKTDFDILIDLSSGDVFPVRFVLSRARAKTKIGLFNKKNKELLDLFIKTDNNLDIKLLINQIEYYLSIINKK